MNAGTRRAILQGVASGLEAMHAAGVAHLDVKPENVLIEPKRSENYPMMLEDVDVRLADFGMSQALANDEQILGGK